MFVHHKGSGLACELVVWIAQAPDDIVGATMVSLVQPSDRPGITDLYRRNYHNRSGRIEPLVRHESQTLVEKDAAGNVVGLAQVGYIAHGPHAYGTIYDLEVALSADYDVVASTLVDACVEWLSQRGAVAVLASPSNGREDVFFAKMGYEPIRYRRRYLPVQAAYYTGA